MTDITTAGALRPTAALRGGTFYRLVWKWHFLAALYVLPFMAMLSLTGGIYLYKPQIEGWLYADRIHVAAGVEALPLEVQLDALDASVGIARLRSITPPPSESHSTVVAFDTLTGARSDAWINPYTAQIIAVQARDTLLMERLKSFHGALMLGSLGTKFVELAAHWAIVMLVTGAILWWPRGGQRVADRAALPSGRGRSFWKQTHLFTGMLALVLITPILISGLPWTDVWGGGLNKVQEATGQSSRSLRFGGDVPGSTTDAGNRLSLAQIERIGLQAGLVQPLEIRPPRDAQGAFWMRSASKNRVEQTELVIDQYSGQILARVDFADNPPLAKAVSLGISFHQGALYGWVNVAQNTLAAALGVLLSVSGFVAWWMRRPKGSLGVPAAPQAQLSWPMMALILALSLIVALALDWLIFRRLGWFRGASAPAPLS